MRDGYFEGITVVATALGWVVAAVLAIVAITFAVEAVRALVGVLRRGRASAGRAEPIGPERVVTDDAYHAEMVAACFNTNGVVIGTVSDDGVLHITDGEGREIDVYGRPLEPR